MVLSKEGYVIEVHSDQSNRSGSGLYYEVGTIDMSGGVNQRIVWRAYDVRYDAGFHTSLSINSNGVIVGVHESATGSNGLFYRVGHLANPAGGNFAITWDTGNNGINYDSGANPHVAINSKGQIVEAHQVNDEDLLHYVRGTLNSDGKGITFNGSVRYNNNGFEPAVALTDNGFVLEVNVRNNTGVNYVLDRMVGRLDMYNPQQIIWSHPFTFDPSHGISDYPAVSSNGAYAIQTHAIEEVTFPTFPLVYSTSAIRNRNDWMRDGLDSLGGKSLSQLVIPGADQAGMSPEDPPEKGQVVTQDQNVFDQLQGGVRYFDLRVLQSAPGQPLETYAGSAPPNIFIGVPVDYVLWDVQRFFELNIKRREVVVLKFSNFRGMGSCSQTQQSAGYEDLKNEVVSSLGKWLLVDTGGARPADISLNTLLAAGPKVIVVVDGDYASSKCNQQEAGFYTYKDWCSGDSGCASTGDPALGQFNVYDQNSNTSDFSSMRDDQLRKFDSYNGKMKNDPNVDTDLFSFAWILGNPANIQHDVEQLSVPASENLALEMSNVGTNPSGLIPNILLVDFYERARATDTAIAMNERLTKP